MPTIGLLPRRAAKSGTLEIGITIFIIFLNISCKINITWYIYIIAFGASASLGLLPLGAAKTGNLEIGTIELGNYYFNGSTIIITVF